MNIHSIAPTNSTTVPNAPWPATKIRDVKAVELEHWFSWVSQGNDQPTTDARGPETSLDPNAGQAVNMLA